jgi:tight adherence protein B
MIPFLLFFVVLIVTFALIAFLTRPTKEQVKIQQRYEKLRTSHGVGHVDELKLEEFLNDPGSRSFAWLEQIYSRTTSTDGLKLLLLQADSKWSPGMLIFLCIAVFTAVYAGLYLFSRLAIFSVAAGAVCSYLPFVYLKFRRTRRVNAFEKILPDSIEMMVRALRAGYSIVAALNIAAEQSVEPAKTEFSEVYKKQNYGLPLRDAMLQMMERMPSTDLRVLVTGILVQKDTGGNLAELLERIAFVIRERVRIQSEIRIHTAQGRLTGWILSLLPPVMLVALNIVSPGYSTAMFTDPTGQLMLYGGVALLIIGSLLIRKIVNGIEV